MADPKYRDIAQDLQRRIESGEFSPGDRLPNEMEFRERYDASRNTVRDALKWLTIRGLIETKAGQGTFVTQLIEPIITTLSEDPETGFRQAARARPPLPRSSSSASVSGKRAKRPGKRLPRTRQPNPRPGNCRRASHTRQFRRSRLSSRQTTWRSGCASRDGHQGHPAPPGVLHRPDPLVAADDVLPHATRGAGCVSPAQAQDFPDGAVKYLLESWGGSVRLPDQDPGPSAESDRGAVLPPTGGRASSGSLADPDRLYGHGGVRTVPLPGDLHCAASDRHQFVINSGNVPEELAAPARDQ